MCIGRTVLYSGPHSIYKTNRCPLTCLQLTKTLIYSFLAKGFITLHHNIVIVGTFQKCKKTIKAFKICFDLCKFIMEGIIGLCLAQNVGNVVVLDIESRMTAHAIRYHTYDGLGTGLRIKCLKVKFEYG